MIEVTLSNGRTILYPANSIPSIQDHVDTKTGKALSFFGHEESGPQHGNLQSSFNEKGGRCHVNPYAVIGECRVVDYSHIEECISLGDIEFIDVKYRERILVKTPTDRFVYLHPDAADYLTSKEITFFGMDTEIHKENERSEFLSHRKFKDCDITVIEGLDLSETEGGRYFLIGLPMSGGPMGPAQGGGTSARVYLIPL